MVRTTQFSNTVQCSNIVQCSNSTDDDIDGDITELYERGVSATFHEQIVSKEASTVPTCHLRALERTYKHNT